MANARYAVTYRDHTVEASTVAFPMTAFDETGLVAADALMDAAKAAIENVMIEAQESKEERSYNIVKAAGKVGATNPIAQRETKWRVYGHDAVTGANMSLEIPCADLTLLADESEEMDHTDAKYTALVSALEAAWVNEQTGNAVVIDGVRHVGRNT